MKSSKNEKGITLVALVVTIIVLIILALISINMVIGENGIIKRTEVSREQYQRSEAEEEVYMYWGDVQVDYKNTLQQKVNSLEQKMREKDSSATAVIEDTGVATKYKGYDIFIPYVESEEEAKADITYFDFQANSNNGTNYIEYMYVTRKGQIYIIDNAGETCITEQFTDLKSEKNLRYYGNGNSGNERYYMLISDKRLWNIKKTGTEEWSLEKVFDLDEIENGKYTERKIINVFEILLLDDGKFYMPYTENEETKLKVYSIENLPENIKINNIGPMLYKSSGTIAMIAENGKIYSANNEIAGECISDNYLTDFFNQHTIKNITAIRRENIIYNVFITTDGKLYMANTETNEIICFNEVCEEFRNSKISQIYIAGQGDFEEEYIAIILEDGNVYYTKDFTHFSHFQTEGFPKDLTIKLI